MNRIFIYLEQFYIVSSKKPTLSKKAISLYKEYLFNPLENIIYVEVNKLIEEDRNYNIDSRPKIKTILKILDNMDLSNPKIVKQNDIICWIQGKEKDEDIWYKCSKNEALYQDKWYKCFKDETIKFAKDKGNADIKNMSATQYIMSQLKYIDEETIRQREYINPKYHDEINKINYKYLIEDHSEELTKMDMSIPFILTNKKNEELKKTFQLLKETGKGLDYISDAFMTYIKKRGEEINENKEIAKDPKKLIPELISLQKEMDSLISECFENNPLFQNKKYKAFSNFMCGDIYPKQLSDYTDFCMRSGFKGKSQEEIENSLNDIIGLFKCINSKLVFQAEAEKNMSDRLIKGESLSINIEKNLISKLKEESGSTFVSKMIEIMTDFEKKNEIKDAEKKETKLEEGAITK